MRSSPRKLSLRRTGGLRFPAGGWLSKTTALTVPPRLVALSATVDADRLWDCAWAMADIVAHIAEDCRGIAQRSPPRTQ